MEIKCMCKMDMGRWQNAEMETKKQKQTKPNAPKMLGIGIYITYIKWIRVLKSVRRRNKWREKKLKIEIVKTAKCNRKISKAPVPLIVDALYANV